ncbi:prepilin-type N-terminal cleavage/methylation domain-containing protein [Variovorax sp. CY25R-8]|nr:prepilin-type N-terminal cleavage/methylation domain-containing protein [Variovorax sp. CY25R-8]
MCRGFTLVELIVVIAVIGILTSIAAAQYSNYVSRTRASSAAIELKKMKQAVSLCAMETDISNCDGGSFGIPLAASFATTKNVLSLDSIVGGVITATIGATDSAGAPLTVILTGSINPVGANILWVNSGTSCESPRGFRSGTGDCS